jgi:hypothetical protein
LRSAAFPLLPSIHGWISATVLVCGDLTAFTRASVRACVGLARCVIDVLLYWHVPWLRCMVVLLVTYPSIISRAS